MASEEFEICDADEIDEGERLIIEISDREIAVFNHNGEYYAVLNFCVHQSGPLCEGQLTGRMDVAKDGRKWIYNDEEKYIVCPWHSWKFDITTGKNPNDSRYTVPTYEVMERDGSLFVRL
jgi:nitrite reductase/ring-hydroxylating ferredoxin subunit